MKHLLWPIGFAIAGYLIGCYRCLTIDPFQFGYVTRTGICLFVFFGMACGAVSWFLHRCELDDYPVNDYDDLPYNK